MQLTSIIIKILLVVLSRASTYVTETFLLPYVASHEMGIDRNLLDLKARVGDMVFLYWQKAAIYGQTRIFDIFHYIASQTPQQPTRPRSTMIKIRLQKVYWEQMTQLFPNDEEMVSQKSDDTIPDTWDRQSLKAEEARPSHRPGKAPLPEETENF
ncbi:HVA22-like protein i [Dendrobium catenatum]|uniref:HVA22-like protein i n=1 Tax=Dendrobium catenatum TaxID=906689 RepID=A0A2I0VCE3_9ASPA|nr:HVA22-like protein i [Dendrobium catenatum]